MDHPPRFGFRFSPMEVWDMTELSTDETALLDHLFIFDLRGACVLLINMSFSLQSFLRKGVSLGYVGQILLYYSRPRDE